MGASLGMYFKEAVSEVKCTGMAVGEPKLNGLGILTSTGIIPERRQRKDSRSTFSKY